MVTINHKHSSRYTKDKGIKAYHNRKMIKSQRKGVREEQRSRAITEQPEINKMTIVSLTLSLTLSGLNS